MASRRVLESFRRAAVLHCALLPMCLVIGCNSKPERPAPRPSSDAPTATSPDRLPPGQLLEGSEQAFGFSFPQGMEVSRPARSIVRAEGAVNFEELTEYVKARLSVRYAEMIGDALTFENARIKGGDPAQTFEVILRKSRASCVLEIHNRTKGPKTEGLTEKQRWERKGLTPDGKLIDPRGME